MAGEPWNRVNIAFPGAVSCVRVHFNSTTDACVKSLLVKNGKVLQLLRSEILQTEVRVLYELLYILNNSYRGNKTFKGLKQVEQCINRLKNMKLDVALQELTELCPNRIQRGLSITAGVCELPSQPMLEWLCLKVLGAAKLMSCTLNRCSRTFSLTKQQMKWEEFIILNMVITSLLSRLWVISRGILVSLSSLYQQLLELLRPVADAQPMPFLTDFPLPADMLQFLGPSDGAVRKVKEDVGVTVERAICLDAGMKPFLKVFRDFTEGKSFEQKSHKADRKLKFKKQMGEAASFTDMASHLEEIIPWCESQKMEKEKRFLNFLHLKCQRMKCLEAAGYSVQRRLRTFRQEACWALSPQGSVPKSCRSYAATRRHNRLRTHFQSLRSRIKSSTLRTGVKKTRLKRQRKRTESGPSVDDRKKRTMGNLSPALQTSGCDDDIDDIFASVGF
ncbi:hypothetical protein JOQ06_030392 [Pogonophryne albipinna]|uniref:Nucleolus and neural progenitor protein-like N-terminal domain-containing protein n=1 Tax=Pogonophryne albipinna TaxID=1090488 RepID=A0AAD6FG40_9TELE|nr:hypothetical protein JOQ06_030392 [Pogonophryne albipinna]